MKKVLFCLEDEIDHPTWLALKYLVDLDKFDLYECPTTTSLRERLDTVSLSGEPSVGFIVDIKLEREENENLAGLDFFGSVLLKEFPQAKFFFVTRAHKAPFVEIELLNLKQIQNVEFTAFVAEKGGVGSVAKFCEFLDSV